MTSTPATAAEPADSGKRAIGHRVRDRFGLLLFLLVLAFLAAGLSSHTWTALISGCSLAAALLVGFFASGARPSRVLTGVLIPIAAAGLGLALVSGGSNSQYGASAVVSAAICAMLLASILRRVLHMKSVTMQTLLGAACCYVLIGLFFSSFFGAAGAFWPHPIFGKPVPHSVYGYFSFTTLTTVGYGDYTMKVPIIQRFAVLEAVFGQLFLATLVARLVSMYRGRSNKVDGDGDAASGADGFTQPG